MNSTLFFVTLGSTILLEFVIYLVFIRKNPLDLFFFSCLINTLTVPLANYTYLYLWNNFLLIEAVVFFGEIFLLWVLLKQKFHIAFLLSFIANAVTALMSFIFII